MKFKSIIFLMALLALTFPALAATHYDQDVNILDPDGKTVYYGTFEFADSASGAIYYTQVFYVGAINYEYAMMRAICSEAGVEDVNGFVQYSFDGTNWIDGTTDSGWDAVGTTAKVDTVGIRDGILFKSAIFMRLKWVAGQNIGSTNLSFWIVFQKPSGVITKNFGSVFDDQ